ncbi:MAG: hypothetical protein LBI08_01590 [Methanomassiliicoccaceae archaeon]|jgi:hypothetical protein|nr:hypothetical protein [Methanomassiliicoccaceae archaeon]
MAVDEDWIKVIVCPWCGCSTTPRLHLTGYIKCGECGTWHFHSSFDVNMKVFTVPKKSMGLKNKHKDRQTVLQIDTSSSSVSFVESYYLKEKSTNILICPWCGCSMSISAPQIGKRIECTECGTRFWWEWMKIAVPDRSLCSRDTNLDKPASRPKKEIDPSWKMGGNEWRVVCPWCRNAFSQNWGVGRATACKECGTVFSSAATFSLVPETAKLSKDKNMYKHRD